MPNPVETITTILTFVILISNFILMLMMWIDKAKAPEKSQDERIGSLEKRVDDIYDKLNDYRDRIGELEQGSVYTNKSLLALLTHSIDGNHVDRLETASNELHEYLTNKGIHI